MPLRSTRKSLPFHHIIIKHESQCSIPYRIWSGNTRDRNCIGNISKTNREVQYCSILIVSHSQEGGIITSWRRHRLQLMGKG